MPKFKPVCQGKVGGFNIILPHNQHPWEDQMTGDSGVEAFGRSENVFVNFQHEEEDLSSRNEKEQLLLRSWKF